MQKFLLFLSMLLPIVATAETTIRFTSPIQQTTLLELYTSEGCSSCPPADRWLSTLKNDPRLWKEIIPIAFHVDYWNYLGWEDKFSRAEYSQRQRNYASHHSLKTIYTPGFLQNGKEWRPWFRNKNQISRLGRIVGRLQINITGNTVTAHFQPKQPITGPLQLNAAWLGFDLVTKVRDGENQGKNLRHDFVSLGMESIQGERNGDTYHWQFTTSTSFEPLPERKGVAFWIARSNNPTPIQATGGWL